MTTRRQRAASRKISPTAIPPIDPAVRNAVRALSEADAYSLLSIEDPERAAMLAPGDTQRIARAPVGL